MIAIITNPKRIKDAELSTSLLLLFLIRPTISLPNVNALINPSESIVDIIVASKPVINKP